MFDKKKLFEFHNGRDNVGMKYKDGRIYKTQYDNKYWKNEFEANKRLGREPNVEKEPDSISSKRTISYKAVNGKSDINKVRKFPDKLRAKIKELSKLGIQHNDIQNDNIIWNGDEPEFIDFGRSFVLTDEPLNNREEHLKDIEQNNSDDLEYFLSQNKK